MTTFPRAYRTEDAAAVAALLRRCWPEDRTMQILHDLHGPPSDDPWRRTLVIEGDRVIVAAATLWNGRRHPGRSWLILDLDPATTTDEDGTALLAALSALAPDHRPRRIQARLSDARMAAFWQSHCFAPLMRTWEGVIDPADPRVDHILAVPAIGAEAFTVEQAGIDSYGEATDFFVRWYAALHTWDPPASWPPDEARAHFLGDLLLPDTLYLARARVRLVGAGCLIRPPFDRRPDELYLSQVGTLGLLANEAHALTARLVHMLLADARRLGARVRFEVDAAHLDLWAILEGLPVKESDRDFAVLANDDDRGRAATPGPEVVSG